MHANPNIHIGTAGWSYEDWKGIVYPEPMPKGVHPLDFHARWFDMVEINSTFYRPASARNAEAWLRRVESNPRFVFTAKLWDRYTHHRDAWPADADFLAFVDGIMPLHDAGKLGALLVQFPWSCKRTPANRQRLARIVDAFGQFPLAVEFRHDSWAVDEVYDGLRERNVAFCNIDQPIFDHSIGHTALVTAPVAYVRFHGRNTKDWFREDASRDDRYNYLYSADELRPWSATVEAIAKIAQTTYVVTNNHFRGQAVVNALQVAAMLGRPISEVPESLLRTYPALARLEALGYIPQP